jgi:hypothetical protein
MENTHKLFVRGANTEDKKLYAIPFKGLPEYKN